jgi:hypothetical protein
MGCEICADTGCPTVPYYKSQFINMGSEHAIGVMFSKAVDNWELFDINSLMY